MLAARSPVFRYMIEHNTGQDIELPDISEETFRLLIG